MTDPYVPVTLNPGAGGSQIDTIEQSDGTLMPVSALAVSPDGIADATSVTPQNPMPVFLADAIPGQPSTGKPLDIVAELREHTRLLNAILRALSMQIEGFDPLQ